jgi:hypothetical protein
VQRRMTTGSGAKSARARHDCLFAYDALTVEVRRTAGPDPGAAMNGWPR